MRKYAQRCKQAVNRFSPSCSSQLHQFFVEIESPRLITILLTTAAVNSHFPQTFDFTPRSIIPWRNPVFHLIRSVILFSCELCDSLFWILIRLRPLPAPTCPGLLLWRASYSAVPVCSYIISTFNTDCWRLKPNCTESYMIFETLYLSFHEIVWFLIYLRKYRRIYSYTDNRMRTWLLIKMLYRY